MEEKSKIFSLLSNLALEEPNFCDEQTLNELDGKEIHYQKAINDIKTFYNDSYKRTISPNAKSHVDDMLSDITSGKFKQYLNKPPVDIASNISYENTPTEKLNDIKFFTEQKEKLELEMKNLVNVDEGTLSTLDSIKTQMEDIERAQNTLKMLMLSLKKLKSNMNSLLVNPELNEDVRRDLFFEANMKNVCEKINEFNQYIEVKKNIERLCKNYEDPYSPDKQNYELPSAISSLLKDVESALLP